MYESQTSILSPLDPRMHCHSRLFYPLEHDAMRVQCQDQHSTHISNKSCDCASLEDGSMRAVRQPAVQLSDINLASRRAEETALRRFQAVSWLHAMVGPLDLSSEPCEEELRSCLRNGIVLCNLINKIHAGAVQKVVERPALSSPPEGPALSAYQYFENVRNFLVAVEDMKLPSFQASDLEMGSLPKVVDCILALKSYYEWKQNGGHGPWRFAGVLKSPCSSRTLEPSFGSSCACAKLEFITNSTIRYKNQHNHCVLSTLEKPKQVSGESAGLFANSGQVNAAQKLTALYNAMQGSDWPDPITAWLHQISQRFPDILRLKDKNMGDIPTLEMLGSLNRIDNTPSQSLLGLVKTILRDKHPEEIPFLVEFMLRKIMEEFEHRFAFQGEQFKSTLKVLPAREDRLSRQLKAMEDLLSATEEDAELKGALKELLTQEDRFSPRLKALEAFLFPTEVDTKMERYQNTDSGNETGGYPTFCKDQQEQERMQTVQLDLEQFRCLDKEWHILSNIQRTDIEGIRNALKTTRQEVVNMQIEWEKRMKNLDTCIQGLAHAAAGYHRVISENRELYNQVQDLRGNIRVYCRVRPFLQCQNATQSTVDFIGDNGTLIIVNPVKQGKERHRTFKFNKVFGPSASQEDIFLDTQPLIRSVLDGYNVCILAYGQTGSGKTYTMTGPDNTSLKDWGVNFRALYDLFEISQNRKDTMKYEVGVQMIEIYNEHVRDLLCTDVGNKRLEIRSNSQQKGFNVPEASMVPVKLATDVLELMNTGQKNRSIGATVLNERSSRSHSVLTVHVQGTDLTSGAILRGCMHLVDLAGSERVDKSEAVGERLKEAQYINKSLSALGDVISSLAQKSMHIPYRNSKLTQLLQDSLGGQAKTLMFVHISPDEDSYGETISTLKFAERVATVELGAAQSNKESGEFRELKEQISSMKDALAKKDGEIERLQKGNHFKVLENASDKVRLKVGGASPHKSCKMSVDVNSQSNHRQPLEEMRNAEIRQSHIFGGIPAQKSLLNSDGLLGEGDAFQPESPSRQEVFMTMYEEDSRKQKVTKVLRRVPLPEMMPSNSEISVSAGLASWSNVLNNQHESKDERSRVCNNPLVSGNNYSDAICENRGREQILPLTSHDSESKLAQGMTESKYADGISLLSVHSERLLTAKYKTMKDADLKSRRPLEERDAAKDSCGRRGSCIADSEAGDFSDVDVWQGKETCIYPVIEQQGLRNAELLPSSGKPRHGIDRRSSGQLHISGTPMKSDNRIGSSARLRRYSLTGSTNFGIESIHSKSLVGKSPTLEAKLAISSDGAAVECYAKTTLPRQSFNNSPVGISSKSSKRWL